MLHRISVLVKVHGGLHSVKEKLPLVDQADPSVPSKEPQTGTRTHLHQDGPLEALKGFGDQDRHQEGSVAVAPQPFSLSVAKHQANWVESKTCLCLSGSLAKNN